MKTEALLAGWGQALSAAESFRGATAPNPPVGAVALNSDGKILGVAAHPKAGMGHAEALLIAKGLHEGWADQATELLVTLEPCNHTGKTPPCTEAILRDFKKVKTVVYGVPDPNPKVKGGGAERLTRLGISCSDLSTAGSDFAALRRRAELLIAPFSKWVKTGVPYVTLKRAIRAGVDTATQMIPPLGQKTFTGPEALMLAHELRKRSDAILTGSGTVLGDDPHFTVRALPDHSDKTRFLAVMDRRKRVPQAWIDRQTGLGFKVLQREDSLEVTLRFLGSLGCLEVLIEAGPSLTHAVLQSGIWDEDVLIVHPGGKGFGGLPPVKPEAFGADDVYWNYRNSG